MSEGNIDIMFNELATLLSEHGFTPAHRETYTKAYAEIFLSLVASQQQQMTGLLSVNCVFVSAIHRLHGANFFA